MEVEAPPETPAIDAGDLDLAADLAGGARAEAVETALSEITLRLDALSLATTTFRSLVSDRLTDYTDQVARAQAITGRDFEDSRREYERTVHDLERALKESDEGLRWLQRGIQQLAGRMDQVATTRVVEQVGGSLQRVVEQVGGSLQDVINDSTRLVTTEIQDAHAELAHRAGTWSTESAERSRQVTAQLTYLSEQLEGLADRPDERVGARAEEVLEPLRASLERIEQAAQVWPDPARLGHSLERIDALADATEDQSELLGTLRRVETVVAALADASDDEAVVARIDEQFDAINQALDQAVRSQSGDSALAALDAQLGNIETLVTRALGPERAELLDNVIERLTAIDQAVGQLSDRPADEMAEVAARLRRLETAVADVSRELTSAPTPAVPAAESPDPDALRRLEDAVERLATAQAEDLERILDVVEAKPADPAAPQRGLADAAVAEQLALMATQIEGLRRRIALRARPAPALDEVTIQALADAVVERLHAGPSPAPTEPPRKPGVRTRKQSS
ncbi:MAG TPA: hypothetical protein VG184_03375 [Acidimicrobiales bacterium]|nr:hypothetical protein [Acidimicrobiales bacterium]